MNESKVRVKISLGTQLPAFFAACVVCVNAIRCYFPTLPNYIYYPIFVMFFILSIRFNRKRLSLKMRRDVVVFFCLMVLLDLYALGTALAYAKESIGSYFEMTVTIILCYAFFLMDDKSIQETTHWIIAISSFYSLSLLLFPSIAFKTNQNYLSITLPIGLCLSLLLAEIVLLILEKNFFSLCSVLYLVLIVVNYICLLQFNARGSMLFPIVVMAYIVLITGRFNLKRTILELVAFVIVLVVGYRLFVSRASEYAIGRMLRLFQNTTSESRWTVWGESIDYILSKRLYLFGCGTNGFIRNLGFYPHNFYLQLVGEFGLLGLVISIYATYKICKYHIKLLRDSNCVFNYIYGATQKRDNLLTLNIAGLLYFFLCFMKSFSFYDIYPMMAFYMWIVGMYDRRTRQLREVV